MRAVAAAGNLCVAWDILRLTGGRDHPHIVPPALPVKVDGQEMTGLVPQQRIDAQHTTTAQVRRNGPLIIRQIRRMAAISALPPGLQTHTLPPLVFACGTVPGTPVFALPAVSIHILPSLKKRHEQRDLVRHGAALRHLRLRRQALRCINLSLSLILRDFYAVRPQ